MLLFFWGSSGRVYVIRKMVRRRATHGASESRSPRKSSGTSGGVRSLSNAVVEAVEGMEVLIPNGAPLRNKPKKEPTAHQHVVGMSCNK